jgi:hypothetical protein
MFFFNDILNVEDKNDKKRLIIKMFSEMFFCILIFFYFCKFYRFFKKK